MPTISASELEQFTARIFEATGSRSEEAARVAKSLVEANLMGHDSHGVIRIPEYVGRIERKDINLASSPQTVVETDSLAVIDGDWGWGQVVGRMAMEVAIEKASISAVGVVSVRNCCHIGRVGEFPAMAAERGMVAMIFVNGHGGGKLVPPWGGRERRLSANPIAAAVPRPDGEPIVMDISTCAIAEGKVRVALHRGAALPPDCIVDADGQPSTDPADFYGPPEGALLPIGRHKGFALALITDILAGALSGAGCARPGDNRIGNGFLAIVIDVEKVRGGDGFDADVNKLVEWVKSSALAPGFDEILVPGEPEAREHARRAKDGIPIADETWRQIAEIASRYGVEAPNV